MTRILIADDTPAVRKALRQLLEGVHPWQVAEAEDGQQAISRALELRPDLIILDLAMPVMDGLTAAREISKVLPETPIVMYTMHWTPPLELAAQKSGVRKVVPKVHSEALLETVRELLGVPAPDPTEAKSGPPAAIDLPALPATSAPEPEVIAASENGPTPNAADAPDKKPQT
jgi:CheY-like chemotaxis protein